MESCKQCHCQVNHLRLKLHMGTPWASCPVGGELVKSILFARKMSDEVETIPQLWNCDAALGKISNGEFY